MSRSTRVILAGLATIAILAPFFSALGYSTIFQSTLTNYDNIGSSGFRWFGSTYLPQSGQRVCAVGLALGNSATDTDAWDILLRSGGSNPDNGTLIDTISTASSSWSTSTAPGYQQFNFSSCHTLTSGGTYFFEVKKNGGGSFTQWKMGKNIGTSYPELTNVWYYDGSAWAQFTGTQPLGIQVLGETGSAISIDFPTDNTSLVGDFNAWTLSYNSPSGDHTFYVDYATSTGNLSASSTRTTASTSIGIAAQTFSGQLQIYKLDNLSPGLTYYAQARLENASSTQVASSSVISFDIGGNSFIDNSLFLNPAAPGASSTITCDSADGAFGSSLCNLFAYLFVPPQATWNNFKDLKAALEDKPPFGYITSVSDALGGLSSSATSTFELPTFTGGLADFFDTIKTLESWLLWFLFGWWVWNKFRHFKY